MTRSDDTATTGERASDPSSGSADGVTRRTVLHRGAATGLAATSLGALGPTGTGAAQSEDGPAPPENLERDFWSSQYHGFRWEWSRDVCAPNELSHYEVQLREGDVTGLPEDSEESVDDRWPLLEEWTVSPDAPIVAFDLQVEGATLVVRAVDDDDGRRSDPVREYVLGGIADPGYTMSPDPERNTLQRGQTVDVPIVFSPVLGNGEDVLGFELDAWLSTPCTASIVDVTVDDPSLSLVAAEYADDGSAVTVVAEGDTGHQPSRESIATIEVAAEEPGGTVLHLDNTALDMADDASSITALTRRATFTVEEGLPAPEDVRIASQVSTSATLTWDWPGELCSDALSHFAVTVEHEDGRAEHAVPAGRPSFQIDLVGPEGTPVEVRAVGADGSTSAASRETFMSVIADPPYTLGADAPGDLTVGESGTLSIEAHQVMAQYSNLMGWELQIDVEASCVATIEDVTVADRWELDEAEFADDGSSVRFSASGDPPEDDNLIGEPLGSVTVTGHGEGETLLKVSDGGLRFLTNEYSYDTYRYFQQFPEEVPEDVQFEDLVVERSATQTWPSVSVVPDLPTVDGAVPQDVDDDGYYRDVDGDGSVGQGDVAAFFQNQHRSAWKRPEYFDFSGNGAVTHGDVVELFDYVALQS